MLHRSVVLEADLAQQVEAQQGEHHDPDGEVYLPVEQPPVIGLVGGAEELEAEGDLDEAQHDLDAVEPAAALRQAAQQRREQREQREGQCKGQRERQHRDHRRPEFTLGGLDQHRSHDRPGAGERHQHKGERKEEYSSESSLVGVLVRRVDPLGGKRDLESSEERGCE